MKKQPAVSDDRILPRLIISSLFPIAANHVLVNVLHVLYTLPQHRTVALDLLQAISGDTRLVKENLQFGKYFYTFDSLLVITLH